MLAPSPWRRDREAIGGERWCTVSARARSHRARTRLVSLNLHVPARNLSPIDCDCAAVADKVCCLSLPA